LTPPGADVERRTIPAPEAFAKVNRICEQHAKAKKSSAWKERTLTSEAINRFGG
jgi:hypothetical protein